MINNSILALLNDSIKDDRNAVSKKSLSDFIESNYFNGKVSDVVVGTSVTRYDILTKPKAIQYFLKLERQFNAFFDTNDCRVFQNGKYVCVEVPNKYIGTYGLKEAISSLQKNSGENSLWVSIGEGLDGKCITYDLTQMPHLLVAGQTGSGKSVFLHNVIISLISQYSADDLNLILIDPKKVEFEFYRGIDCVREVVTTTDRAVQKINDLCDEMDSRYKMFSELSVRDIESYNEKSDTKLPRIVLIIEELSDLAITSKDNAIKDISRLLYKARACGIHVILSTQRPDSDFMTGKLKSNFQCRVVFSMASRWDSRVALGRYGAEKLRGNGDGIFRSNNGQKNTRFQSPLVTEKEIKAVVNYIKNKRTK